MNDVARPGTGATPSCQVPGGREGRGVAMGRSPTEGTALDWLVCTVKLAIFSL